MRGFISDCFRIHLSGGDGPEDWRAVPLYLAMSYLYKRSNRFWHQLIKHDLVHTVWHPLVEMTRLRHVRYRRSLAREGEPSQPLDKSSPLESNYDSDL